MGIKPDGIEKQRMIRCFSLLKNVPNPSFSLSAKTLQSFIHVLFI